MSVQGQQTRHRIKAEAEAKTAEASRLASQPTAETASRMASLRAGGYTLPVDVPDDCNATLFQAGWMHHRKNRPRDAVTYSRGAQRGWDAREGYIEKHGHE